MNNEPDYSDGSLPQDVLEHLMKRESERIIPEQVQQDAEKWRKLGLKMAYGFPPFLENFGDAR